MLSKIIGSLENGKASDSSVKVLKKSVNFMSGHISRFFKGAGGVFIKILSKLI